MSLQERYDEMVRLVNAVAVAGKFWLDRRASGGWDASEAFKAAVAEVDAAIARNTANPPTG